MADASDFSFAFSFDAIFSHATLHRVEDAENAVQCMTQPLKTGGRLVAEFGGKGNVSTITTAVQQPLWELMQLKVDVGWYFPSIGEYATVLEKHGLAVYSAVPFEKPTRLEDGEQGLRNWIHMFGERVLRHVPEAVKQQALERTEEKVRDRLFHEGQWYADYTRLRVVAYKA